MICRPSRLTLVCVVAWGGADGVSGDGDRTWGKSVRDMGMAHMDMDMDMGMDMRCMGAWPQTDTIGIDIRRTWHGRCHVLMGRARTKQKNGDALTRKTREVLKPKIKS